MEIIIIMCYWLRQDEPNKEKLDIATLATSKLLHSMEKLKDYTMNKARRWAYITDDHNNAQLVIKDH